MNSCGWQRFERVFFLLKSECTQINLKLSLLSPQTQIKGSNKHKLHIRLFTQILRCDRAEVPSPLERYSLSTSLIVVSLYFAGFSSDNNSFRGPYIFVLGNPSVEKKLATEILGPSFFANTLCATLTNLSFVINCKFPDNPNQYSHT